MSTVIIRLHIIVYIFILRVTLLLVFLHVRWWNLLKPWNGLTWSQQQKNNPMDWPGNLLRNLAWGACSRSLLGNLAWKTLLGNLFLGTLLGTLGMWIWAALKPLLWRKTASLPCWELPCWGKQDFLSNTCFAIVGSYLSHSCHVHVGGLVIWDFEEETCQLQPEARSSASKSWHGRGFGNQWGHDRHETDGSLSKCRAKKEAARPFQ